MKNGILTASLGILACVATARSATAQCEIDRLLPEVSVPGAEFGTSVCVEGDWALVGVARLETGGPPGSVFVYHRTEGGWVRTQELSAGDATGTDGFGNSVALYGDTALVGAPGADPFPSWGLGAGYVFELRDAVWVETAKLIAYETTVGWSVALGDEWALLGAPSAERAFVFRRTGTEWTFVDELRAPGYGEHPQQGFSVALSGDTAAVGGPRVEWITGVEDGRVFVHEFTEATGWVHTASLVNSDSDDPDWFGWSISMSGDRILASAPDPAWMFDVGHAYVFERNDNGTPADRLDDEWVQVATLAPDTAIAGSGFGGSVSLSGRTAIVGADGVPVWDLPTGEGSAYVFRCDAGDDWTQVAHLTPMVGTSFDEFGAAVAVSGEELLVSAPRADVEEEDSGAVHAFRYLPVEAETEVRNGSSVNPLWFDEVAPPLLGATWQTTVELGFPGADTSVLFLGLGGPDAGTATDFGELLCQPPYQSLGLSDGVHSIPIPNSCGLAGVPFSTQAAALGGGNAQLTNALDIRPGAF